MPVHLTISAEVMSLRADYLVRQTLVIAFIVIVRDEILNGCPQRTFTEEDQPFQTGLFDAAHESLRVRVQIRTSRWQLDRFHTDIVQRA